MVEFPPSGVGPARWASRSEGFLPPGKYDAVFPYFRTEGDHQFHGIFICSHDHGIGSGDKTGLADSDPVSADIRAESGFALLTGSSLLLFLFSSEQRYNSASGTASPVTALTTFTAIVLVWG